MKYISFKAGSKGFSNLLLMFVFTVLFNASVFGQSAQKLVHVNNVKVYSNSKKEKVAINSSSNSLNFIMWFMGTKQGQKDVIFKESTNPKIQVITSGSAPNRLLIKAFLKKAVDSDSMIA
ncbi:hypothetical protein ACNQGP_00080 [Flavobacterium sp. GT2N3]|uniref:hypothetical protein n=1 Tax=unclassified Flavobacterium TaxID=196869 RepID=UPI003AAB7B14